MRAKLANLNHCTVPFLSRAVVILSWCDSAISIIIYLTMASFKDIFMCVLFQIVKSVTRVDQLEHYGSVLANTAVLWILKIMIFP